MSYFIKTVFHLILFGLIANSCEMKTPSQQLNELKKSMNNQVKADNLKIEKFERLIDSLYFISDSLYFPTIYAIDSIIKYDQLVDKFVLSDFNTLKGDIHYEHNNFRQAIVEYSKLGGLYRKVPPRRLIYRAASYIKLNKVDSAYLDLRNSLDNKTNLWYLANFFETNSNKDSAIYYYKQLYTYDSTAYNVCNKRIIELSKQKPKYYSELHFINN